jgi:[pyruvate, water dikinase]-phosphate phosphotransferase / [pyruvate, water dikinase] kinase
MLWHPVGMTETATSATRVPPTDHSPQPIYVVSDGTGLTAETVVSAAAGQFFGTIFDVRRRPLVRTIDQARSVINEAAETHGIIVYTLVVPELRRAFEEESGRRGVPSVDIIGGLVQRLEEAFGLVPAGEPGLRGTQLDPAYFGRIDAIEYTVSHDDGQHPETLGDADVVLVGVSRTSKTPLSIFLAHYRGWKVANVPMVLGIEPPHELFQIDQRKIIGLTIQPGRLVNLRRARLESLGRDPDGPYTSHDQVTDELAYARRVYRHGYPWPILDTTNRSVEEVAREIIAIVEQSGNSGLPASV